MKLQYVKPLASITVDTVIFGFDENKLKVLLIERASDPEKGKWALPGGFMEKGETLELAGERLLAQLTGVKDIYLEQFKAFSEPKRHPLGRVVTVPFYALVKPEVHKLKASQHAKMADWVALEDKPKLAFDHDEIFKEGLRTLRRDLRLKPIGFELLPQKFTLRDLQLLYEAVLGEDLDRRNFRRKIKGMDILKELKEVRKGAHKDAQLYKFDKRKYDQLRKSGFSYKF